MIGASIAITHDTYHFAVAAYNSSMSDNINEALQYEIFSLSCDQSEDQHLVFRHKYLNFIGGSLFQIHNLVLCLSIVTIKSSDDILQNVSKLDHLL